MTSPAPLFEGARAPSAIDEGIRRWYETCSCSLSDADPEIKAALDAERAAADAPPVDPGICEVAEAQEPATPVGYVGRRAGAPGTWWARSACGSIPP